MYLNKATIIGNLTRDPELRAIPSGTQVATFSVATNRVWRDKEGAKKEDFQFNNVVVFGRTAETAAQYLKKGSQVLIEGRMQTRSWDDKTSGEKKYRTEIIADTVQFGSRPTGSTGGAPAPVDAPAKGKPAGKSTDKPMDTIEYPEESINPEDIPF
jgi:single-strand DNA-binding protein